MKDIFAVARLTFKEGLGYKIFYSVSLMAAAATFFSVLLSGFFMRDIAKIIVDFGLSAVGIGGLLVPFFLTVNMVAGDMENRTVFTLLAQPLSRPGYIVGKFMGLALLSALVMSTLTAAGLIAVWTGKELYGSQFFTSFSLSSYITAAAMNFMAIQLFTSLVILWCCIVRSSFLATLLTLATYLIGQTLDDIIMFINASTNSVPISHTVKMTVKIAQYLFPNLAAFDFKFMAAHGLHIPMLDPVLLTLYAAGYITVTLTIASFSFKGRDLS